MALRHGQFQHLRLTPDATASKKQRPRIDQETQARHGKTDCDRSDTIITSWGQ